MKNGAQGVDAGNVVVIQLEHVPKKEHASKYVVYTAYLEGKR